jgi:HEAT repeat protein
VPALIAALTDTDGNVRRLAASGLASCARRGQPALLQRRPMSRARRSSNTSSAPGRLGDERARPALELIAADSSEMDYNRAAARAALRALSIPNL